MIVSLLISAYLMVGLMFVAISVGIGAVKAEETLAITFGIFAWPVMLILFGGIFIGLWLKQKVT